MVTHVFWALSEVSVWCFSCVEEDSWFQGTSRVTHKFPPCTLSGLPAWAVVARVITAWKVRELDAQPQGEKWSCLPSGMPRPVPGAVHLRSPSQGAGVSAPRAPWSCLVTRWRCGPGHRAPAGGAGQGGCARGWSWGRRASWAAAGKPGLWGFVAVLIAHSISRAGGTVRWRGGHQIVKDGIPEPGLVGRQADGLLLRLFPGGSGWSLACLLQPGQGLLP